MWEKSEVRKRVKELRRAMDRGLKSRLDARIREKAARLPAIGNSDCVYCYVSTEPEVDTRKLLEYFWREGKQTAVPRVEGREINFYFVSSFEELEPGCMGILEPREGCARAERPDCPVIVPGLAFDLSGGRVGYGGGYYDRFFQREPSHRRIGLAYDFQIFEKLCQENGDGRVDHLITP